MKKKLISLILVFSMILTSALYFVSCNENEEGTEEPTSTETESTTDKATEGKETDKSTESGTSDVTDKETDESVDSGDATEPTTEPSSESGEASESASESGEATESASESGEATESASESGEASESASESGEATESDTESGEATESDTESDKATEPDTESDKATEPETEPEKETECYHPYAATQEGHYKPACAVCGKKDGKMQDHEYEEKVEDEGDLLLYSFRCSVCKFRAYKQEVPYAINLFFSAGELSTKADVTGGFTQEFGFDSGVGFARYSKTSGGTTTITVMSGGEASVPSGKYLVMKVRLPKSKSAFTASIQSVYADASQPMNFAGLPSGWVTIVVDLTKAVKTNNTTDASGNPVTQTNGYAPDASGDYYLKSLTVTASTGEGESFEFAYALLCDRLEDAQLFIENEKTVVTYDDILSGSATTDKKECVDENGNPIEHKYVVNPDGTHTLTETCYQCGLAAVENEPHTYAQVVLENGDYSIACSGCKHVRFSENVNCFLDAFTIFNGATNYYRNTKNGIFTDEEGGFDYASFSGQGNTAQIIFPRNTKDSSATEKAASFPVGTATYFVVRLRTNKSSMNYTFTFATTTNELVHGIHNGIDKGYFPKTNSFTVPISLGGDNQWTTYVMDLSTLIPDEWTADENGNRTVCTLYCNIGSTDYTSEVNMEFEYMAFVDNWDEVRAICSDETVVNVTGTNAGSRVYLENLACVGEHSASIVEDNGAYKAVCGTCGTVVREYGVKVVNNFMPAEVLKNRTSNGTKTGTSDLTYMQDADGETYIRLNNFAPNSQNWGAWAPINNSAVKGGRYMAIKLRVGKNGLGQKSLALYINSGASQAAGNQWPTGPVSFEVTEDGEWHTVVVDLVGRLAAKAYMADADGGYRVNCMQIRPFSNNQTAAEPDDYMDIAYIAFFDSFDEIPKAVVSDTYEWSADSSTSALRNTADSSCVTHTAVESVSGATHTITCEACQKTLKTFTVSEDINWYSPLGDMDKMANGLAKFQYDGDANILYNRYSGTGGCHLNVSGGNGPGDYTAETFETGSYVMIKYRLKGTVSFEIATSDHGYNESLNPKRPMYSGLGNRSHIGALSDWTVVIIEIPDSSAEKTFYYTKNSEQQIAIRFTASGGEYIFDLAYVAVLDSLDEADLLLEEGETYTNLGGSWDGSVDVTPDETEPETEPETETETETETEPPRDPAITEIGADKLKAPVEITGTYQIDEMTEGDISFVRYSHMTINGDGWSAIGFLNNSHTAYGRYVAIKFRIGDNGLNQSYLKVYTGTTGRLVNDGQSVSFKVSEGGDWCVVVIDLLERIQDSDTYMVKNADGSYTVKYFSIRPFSNIQYGATKVDDPNAELDPTYTYMHKYLRSDGRQRWYATELTEQQMADNNLASYAGLYKMSVRPEHYIDIAYIKFFEDMSQLDEAVDSTTYYWSVDQTTNSHRNTADGTCVTCTPYEAKDGSTYSIVCTTCGKIISSVTLSESVTKYYSANEINTTAKVYYDYRVGTHQFLVEDGVSYTESNGLVQIIWQRVRADMSGTQSSSDGEQYSENVGNAKYLVVKARSNDSNGVLGISLSTTAHNAPLKVAETNMENYYNGYTNQRDSWTVEVDGAPVTKYGVLAGGEYRSSTGYKSVTIIPKGTGDGEWVTYVIDLSLFGDAYAKNEGEDFYDVDSFLLGLGGKVDISYMAFVEGDWTDIDELVTETKVAKITATDGTHSVVNIADEIANAQ